MDTEHERGVNFEDMVNFMDYTKDPVELPTGLPRVSSVTFSYSKDMYCEVKLFRSMEILGCLPVHKWLKKKKLTIKK